MAGYDDQTDEVLMGLVSGGDRRAFAALAQRHASLFFSAAFRMCGQKEEAEDVVQEAFLKLWERPGVFDPSRGTKFSTWFYRVVMNLAIDRGRRRRPHAAAETLETLPDGRTSADARLIEQEQEVAIERAIQALPERQRAALNLCFYEGMSNKEAADILGVGVKALESLLMRAKAALREDLSRAGVIMEDENKKRRVSHAG